MTKFRRGTYKVTCDLTGGTFLANQCKTQWDQSFVNGQDIRPKQPQDYITFPTELAYPLDARSKDIIPVPSAQFNNAFSTGYDSVTYINNG